MIRKGNALSAEWTAWSPPSESLFPRQRNGYDCGVFTCMYTVWASIPDSSTDFSQMDMPYLRRWLTHAITEQYLREEHNTRVKMLKGTNDRPDQRQLDPCGKGRHMNGESLCGGRSSLQTTTRKLEDLSLNQFLVGTKSGHTNEDEIQVEKTTTSVKDNSSCISSSFVCPLSFPLVLVV